MKYCDNRKNFLSEKSRGMIREFALISQIPPAKNKQKHSCYTNVCFEIFTLSVLAYGGQGFSQCFFRHHSTIFYVRQSRQGMDGFGLGFVVGMGVNVECQSISECRANVWATFGATFARLKSVMNVCRGEVEVGEPTV